MRTGTLEQREIKKLAPWEEFVGVLEQVREDPDNNSLILTFKTTVSLEIPSRAIDNKKLETIIGDHIHILRTDDQQEQYRIMTEGVNK